MNDLVSVIIPNYNYGHYLEACIESVLAQTHRNLQVIVVDDGSTDDSSERLAGFGNRINCIYQSNQGLSAARNSGLEAVEGDFVQLLDADDLLHPRAIERRLASMSANLECDLVVCKNYYFTDRVPAVSPNPFAPRWGIHSIDLGPRLFQSNIAPPHAFLARTSVYRQVGSFDTSLKACEDYDYWLRALALGFEPHYCRKGLVYYRRHSSSMSANLTQQLRHDIIMHYRVAKMLETADLKGGLENRVISRAYAALGMAHTLNRNADLKEGEISGLRRLYEEQIDCLENELGQQSSAFVDLRLVCALYLLSEQEASFVWRSGLADSETLRRLSVRSLNAVSNQSLWLDLLKHYVFAGGVNLKTRTDYCRWFYRGRKWRRAISDVHHVA